MKKEVSTLTMRVEFETAIRYCSMSDMSKVFCSSISLSAFRRILLACDLRRLCRRLRRLLLRRLSLSYPATPPIVFVAGTAVLGLI